MKIVVTGGGTGGHIYPALAVAEALKAEPQVEAVLYIGKQGGLESEVVPERGLDFEGIAFYGMPRGKTPLLPFRLIGWLLALRQAIGEAEILLRRFRPTVVFGTGGYVSAPVLMAAKRLKIPYVLHEPDAQPGLANRVMAKNAAIITTSFSEGATHLQKPRQRNQEVLVTGNPIRGDIGQMCKAEALKALGLDWPIEKTVLLVTGGSQGARRLNTAVVEALPALLNELDLAVVHLTGRKLHEETRAMLSEQGEAPGRFYQVQPYSSDMAALLALADIALCRAGSLSLSEMYACGIPTILVPYPHAAADHQRKNAMASVRAGASVLVEDNECDAGRIFAELRSLTQSDERRQTMSQAAKALGHPDATARIAARLLQFGSS